MFSLTSIAASAAVMAVASGLLLFVWRKDTREGTAAGVIAPALVAGLSVLVYRAAGNTGILNEDPVPAVSPNDVLCPVVTYAALGMYAAFRTPSDHADWERRRAALTLVSLVVNIVTI